MKKNLREDLGVIIKFKKEQQKLREIELGKLNEYKRDINEKIKQCSNAVYNIMNEKKAFTKDFYKGLNNRRVTEKDFKKFDYDLFAFENKVKSYRLRQVRLEHDLHKLDIMIKNKLDAINQLVVKQEKYNYLLHTSGVF